MTQEQTAPSKSTNEAARNLREYMEAHFEAGRVPSGDTRLMQSTLDAALVTERRNTVERIKRRAVLGSDDYSDDDYKYAEISLADFFAILDEEADRDEQ